MNYYWLGFIVLALGIGAFFFFTRLGATVLLIAKTQPYEQAGTSEGPYILIIGDSTGYGTGVTHKEHSVAGRLGTEYPNASIENQSINGQTIADAIKRFAPERQQYDLVLLQLGGNDILQKRSLEMVEEDVKALLKLLAGVTSEVVMISAGNVGAAPAFTGNEAATYETLSREYHAKLMTIMSENPRFTYISLFDEREVDPFVAEPNRYLASDGLHPSGEGYGLWYQKVAPAIQSALSRSDE